MNQYDKRFRNILVETGVLDDAKAEEAWNLAQEKQDSFLKVIVEKGHCQERDIIGSIAGSTNYPPIDLEKVTFDQDAIKCLSEELAKYYCVLPVAKIGNILTMAIANPFDLQKLDDVRIVTGCDIRPVISTERVINAIMAKAYNPGEQEMRDLMGEISGEGPDISEGPKESEENADIRAAEKEGMESPIIKLVNLLIYQGIRDKASDIHVEAGEREVRVRYRFDGVLHEANRIPKKMLGAITSRIKIMSDLDIAERRRPQDGKFKLKVEGRQIDFRVSILPTIHGEKVVMRILDSSNLTLSLDALGWEPETLSIYREAINSPWGMVLVTGPTGSGKSTTLYSSLKETLSDEENVVTVEDPVEYQLEGVNQVPVNPKRGLTFAAALRSILRQDPDIIMIGEIRDMETVEIAVKAALTGHLVFSTVHTNDAPSPVTRLVDMGVDPFLVASSVIMVTAQRLGRKLCKECSRPMDRPPDERLVALGFTPEDMAQEFQLLQPGGCSRCLGGYKGRFALVEALKISEPIKKLIVEGGSAIDIKAQAMKEGMLTLRRVGIKNAMRGKTSMEEIVRVTMADES